MDEVNTAIWLEGLYLKTLGRAARMGLPSIDRKTFWLLVAGELAMQASRDKMASEHGTINWTWAGHLATK